MTLHTSDGSWALSSAIMCRSLVQDLRVRNAMQSPHARRILQIVRDLKYTISYKRGRRIDPAKWRSSDSHINFCITRPSRTVREKSVSNKRTKTTKDIPTLEDRSQEVDERPFHPFHYSLIRYGLSVYGECPG